MKFPNNTQDKILKFIKIIIIKQGNKLYLVLVMFPHGLKEILGFQHNCLLNDNETIEI